jgi:hypothetical protein
VNDALRAHLEATASIDWAAPSVELVSRLAAVGPRPSARDPHLEYLDAFDLPRGADRAAGMRLALDRARTDARAALPLDWPLLQSWQALVLGREAGFRPGPAHARKGVETYGHWPTLEAEFAAKLEADARASLHPVAAAGRAYLDLCFFHPFEDGNARAARLAFDYWLTRGGLAIGHVRLLFAAPRVAGRREGYLGFLQSIVRACEVR